MIPDGVELIDGGTPGLETVLLLQGRRCAIIVDAADIDKAPGEWQRLSSDESAVRSRDVQFGGAIHNAGLAEALALGRELDLLPPRLTIYGVQPLELGWSSELSEPVRRAVPAVCAAILGEIGCGAAAKDAEDDGQDTDH